VDPLHPERALQIGVRLHPDEKALPKQFLSDNLDVFAWAPTDMPDIGPDIICHRLAINPGVRPVK